MYSFDIPMFFFWTCISFHHGDESFESFFSHKKNYNILRETANEFSTQQHPDSHDASHIMVVEFFVITSSRCV